MLSDHLIRQVLEGRAPGVLLSELADSPSPEGTPPEDETPGSPGGTPVAGTPAPEGKGWGGAKLRKYVLGSYAKERGEGSPPTHSPASPSRVTPSPSGSPVESPEDSSEGDGQVEWNEHAVSELREIFHREGLKTRVLAVPIESFEFIQGALDSDDRRHENLGRALENGDPIPPLLATPAGAPGRLRCLDGHHRILASVQRLRPPYPRMRTIEVRYPDGRPFSWKDGELGKRLFKAIPGFRKQVAEAAGVERVKLKPKDARERALVRELGDEFDFLHYSGGRAVLRDASGYKVEVGHDSIEFVSEAKGFRAERNR